MTLAQSMVVAACVASIVLVSKGVARPFAMVALIASAVEGLLVFGVVDLTVIGINIYLLLSIALCAAGAIAWSKESGKSTVTAATAVALVGAIQLAQRLL